MPLPTSVESSCSLFPQLDFSLIHSSTQFSPLADSSSSAFFFWFCSCSFVVLFNLGASSIFTSRAAMLSFGFRKTPLQLTFPSPSLPYFSLIKCWLLHLFPLCQTCPFYIPYSIQYSRIGFLWFKETKIVKWCLYKDQKLTLHRVEVSFHVLSLCKLCIKKHSCAGL